jgi:cytochrome d ubiquinol oxidase subunit I
MAIADVLLSTTGLLTLADLDAVLLSRIQFALTIMFHYLFPPLTIGLGVIMVGLEGMYLKTKDPAWERACKFWTKLFALTFALGVASGIVMEFQFGTNWETYSRFVGDVFGSALAAEAIFAFFLESGFLAVLVFGWDRVGPKMHFFSTLMVALGSSFSAIWIVVANSWQQTPTGHHVVLDELNGGRVMERAEITNFWQLVFNPSSIDRLTHVYIGALILGSFFVMSISAWYILKRRHDKFARYSFKMGLVIGSIFSILAAVQGHQQGQTVTETQPAKLAAFESFWEDGEGDNGILLFGIPNNKEERTDFAVYLPIERSMNWLVTGSTETDVIPLKDFLPEERPNVFLTFVSFRTMIALGTLFIVVTLVTCFFWWRGSLFEKRWLMWLWVFMVIGAYAANQLGWLAAEFGRQPYIVYPMYAEAGETTDREGVIDRRGVEEGDDAEVVPAGTLVTEDMQRVRLEPGLRTKESASRVLKGADVLASTLMFGVIYSLLLAVYLFVMNTKIQRGPEEPDDDGDDKSTGFLGVASERAGDEARMTGRDVREPGDQTDQAFHQGDPR